MHCGRQNARRGHYPWLIHDGYQGQGYACAQRDHHSACALHPHRDQFDDNGTERRIAEHDHNYKINNYNRLANCFE